MSDGTGQELVPILVTGGAQEDRVVDGTVRALHLRSTYPKALAAVGGVPVVYGGPAEEAIAAAALAHVGGLLLTGGGDIVPGRFGQTPHPTLYGLDDERDAVELMLARLALDSAVPVFGICRGLQILTVAEGVALIQDIRTARPDAIAHEGRERRRTDDVHTVRLLAGTRTGDLLRAAGGDEIPVNSFHHQAAAAVPEGWRPFAWAPDGILEGMERPGEAFAVAVQWHPEDRWPEHAADRALFRSFVAAARAHRASRGAA